MKEETKLVLWDKSNASFMYSAYKADGTNIYGEDYPNIDKRLEQLKVEYPDANIVKGTYEEFFKDYELYHKNLASQPFQEITEDQYWNYLESVPPKRFDGNQFFVGELFSGNVSRFCFRAKGKYYSAHRNIFASDEELRKDISEFLKTQKA